MSATGTPEAFLHMRALALRYGLAVVPLHRLTAPGACSCRKGTSCSAPGKHPWIRWAERPATPPTPEELERWERVRPDSRVGLLLGDELCALDVDEHGISGMDELAELERTFGRLPATWRALTPSGGLHVYFRLGGEVRSTTHPLGRAVQLRAGRHVMACPPCDGRTWELSPREAELAVLPAWIPQLVRELRGGSNGSGWLPLENRLQPNARHLSYVAAAAAMARINLPYGAIVAALVTTDELIGAPPKHDRDELERIAGWAVQRERGNHEGGAR